MPYQYVREPLRAEDADKLSNACNTAEEKLIIWTLLDTELICHIIKIINSTINKGITFKKFLPITHFKCSIQNS